MTEFVLWCRDVWQSIINLLDSYSFEFWGMNVSIIDLLFGSIIFAMALSFLWRGVKG